VNIQGGTCSSFDDQYFTQLEKLVNSEVKQLCQNDARPKSVCDSAEFQTHVGDSYTENAQEQQPENSKTKASENSDADSYCDTNNNRNSSQILESVKESVNKFELSAHRIETVVVKAISDLTA
jgi:chromosomal replication initiation ATPase DnaA